MLLIKLKKVIILACLLLISGCSHTVVKPSPLPLPICNPLAQISADEFVYLCSNNGDIVKCPEGEEERSVAISLQRDTMVKIVKRDAQRKACTELHKAVIESTH